MENEKLKNELRDLLKNHPKSFASVIRGRKYSNLYEELMNSTKWLDSRYNAATRIYCILNDINEFPKCALPSCNNSMIGKNVVSVHQGWRKYCSSKCALDSKERIEHTKSTMIKKYGSASYLGSEECRKIRDKWCEERGVSNPFQLDWVNKKRGETMIERYGHEFTQQCPELVEKCRESCRRKFGTEHQWANEEIRIKNISSIVEKYGVENVFDNDFVREKQKRTFRTRRYESFLKNDKVIPLFSLEDFLKCENPNTEVFRWKCIENGHNKEFESVVDENSFVRYGEYARCWDCHPRISSGFSKEEIDVCDFLRKNSDFDIISRNTENRKIMPGMEIDILIPEKKIGIEFDGIFFHSDTSDSDFVKTRHLDKTNYMESIGWKLIHIFEDEWWNSRKIVESRLLSAIGCPKRRIYGRTCEIREIEPDVSKMFLGENHIQGNINSKIRIGLFFENELVANMTFGKPRFNRKFEYELLRYASSTFTQVIGGAGKILKYFENKYKPSSLISYADRRWSNGNLYKALGFSFIENTKPNYFYVKGENRFNRIMFQKHKLKNILENFDQSKTEKENMFINGYRIIYDSGNMVFGKRYNLTI